jgi:hypothetical protein
MMVVESFTSGQTPERASIDPVSLFTHIVQQVLSQLAHQYGLSDSRGGPSEELIAVALGNRLAQAIVSEDQSRARHRSAENPWGDEFTDADELIERNSDLAAALGACDCWGFSVDCSVCDGAGAPGWALPDRRLFSTYVHPALRAMTQYGASSSPKGQSTNQRNGASPSYQRPEEAKSPQPDAPQSGIRGVDGTDGEGSSDVRYLDR